MLLRLALVGPVLLALAIVAFYWPLLCGQYIWFDHPDGISQVLPWFQVQVRSWALGEPPLWDPYHFGGQSLIGQVQPGVAYPLNILFFLIASRTGGLTVLHLNAYYVFLHYAAALCAFAMCRRLGLSSLSACLAGFVFATAGYVGTANWPQMLSSALWTPLIVGFVLPRRDGPRSYVDTMLAGAFLGLALLGGHHQFPTFTVVVLLVLLLLRGGGWQATASHALILFVVAAVVSAVQTLPAIEYGQNVLRWVGTRDALTLSQRVPYNAHSVFSTNPAGLLFGLIIAGVSQHTEVFVGVAIAALAAIGLLTNWASLQVRLIVATGITGALLALGGDSFFHGLAYWLVPGFDKARNASAALGFTSFAAAVLAAYGAEALLTSVDPALLKRVARAVAIVAAVAGSVVFVSLAFPTSSGVVVQIAWCALAGGASAAVLYLCGTHRMRPVTGFAVLAGISMMQLYPVVNSKFTHATEAEGFMFRKLSSRFDDKVAFLKQNLGPQRMEVIRDEVGINFGDMYGVPQYDGFVSVSKQMLRVMFDERGKDLLGVKYKLSSKTLEPVERTGYMPRAWMVHHVDTRSTEEEAIGDLLDQSRDLHASASIHAAVGAIQVEQCPGSSDDVKLTELGLHRVTLIVRAGCAGMVILADAYDPNWKVSVNGVQKPIHKAFGLVRGVHVPAGQSDVRFYYSPTSVYVGLALSVAGSVAVLLIWLSRRRRCPAAIVGHRA